MSSSYFIFKGYTKNNKEYNFNMYLEKNYLIIQTQSFNNSIKSEYFNKQDLLYLKNFNLFSQFNSLEEIFKYLKNIINIQKQNNIYSIIEESDNKLILMIPIQKRKIKNILFELKEISKNYDNNNYNNENNNELNTYNNYNQINNNNYEQIINMKNEFEIFKEKYINDFQYLINEISALKNENQLVKNLLMNIQNEINFLKNNNNPNSNIENQNINHINNNINQDINNNSNDYYYNTDINDQYYNNNNYNKKYNNKLIKKSSFNSKSILKSKTQNYKQNNNNLKFSKTFSQNLNNTSKLSFNKQKSYLSSFSLRSTNNNSFLKYFPNTTIIKNKDEKIILSLLNSIISNCSSFELLFKASKDGENIKIFHNKIDGKGPILFFIKTDYKNIRIGGFSSIPWSSDGKMKSDSNAFIFSIDKNKKFVLKNSKDNFAVIHAGYYSLCFGDDDLHIGEKCLSDEKCNYCGHCKTFVPLNNNNEEKYPKNLLGEKGKKYFKVIDYEVYKVNFNKK